MGNADLWCPVLSIAWLRECYKVTTLHRICLSGHDRFLPRIVLAYGCRTLSDYERREVWESVCCFVSECNYMCDWRHWDQKGMFLDLNRLFECDRPHTLPPTPFFQ